MSQDKLRFFSVVAVCVAVAGCSRQESSSANPEKLASPPVAVSITPNSGSGAHGTFTFVTSDPKGASQLYRTHVQFRPAASPSALCYVEYFPPDKIYLMNDALSAWLEPIAIGANATLPNSYCGVRGAGSSIQEAGNDRTVKFEMSFKAPMSGNNSISLFVEDHQGTTSGTLGGTWTVQ